MEFVAREYGKQYAPNTRETFRRQVLHQFVQAHIVDYNPFEPDLPTNSPRAHYAITEAAVAAIRTFGTKKWRQAIRDFILQQGSLLTIYEKRRTDNLVPIRLPKGKILELSPGSHNELQRAVIEQFAPRFAKNAELLYLGDTAKKTLFINNSVLDGLRIAIMEHEKLPDVMLYQEDQDRVFLVEAVTSHGPMSPKRVIEFEQMLSNCTARRVFVSAFPDFQEFRRHLRNIAWETEVWLAEIPDHLIHF